MRTFSFKKSFCTTQLWFSLSWTSNLVSFSRELINVQLLWTEFSLAVSICMTLLFLRSMFSKIFHVFFDWSIFEVLFVFYFIKTFSIQIHRPHQKFFSNLKILTTFKIFYGFSTVSLINYLWNFEFWHYLMFFLLSDDSFALTTTTNSFLSSCKWHVIIFLFEVGSSWFSSVFWKYLF